MIFLNPNAPVRRQFAAASTRCNGCRAARPAAKLDRMSSVTTSETDCGDCPAGRRCWADAVSPGAGFLVRRVKPLSAGSVLFGQGEAFEAPYVVTSGCVAVTELLADGAERIVAFRLPGDMVGLESCNQPVHRYGAQAISDATVCRLRWSSAGIAARGAPLLRALLAKAIAQSPEVAPWAGLTAVERVRAFVDDYRRRTDQPLPMTRAQIGQFLGLAEETVVRAFKMLA